MLSLPILAACSGPPASQPPPTTTDSETGDVHILPRDSFPLPTDSSPDLPPNLAPSHWVTLEQAGVWNLTNTAPPWGSFTGVLRIREYVDEIDTADPAFECDVTYTLSGTELTQNSCSLCDFVMEVEHYVNEGTPETCHDPDVPLNGSIWNMGFDSGTQTIYRNYGGTGLWLPWYEATRTGQRIDFDWSAVLAIEVMDSGTM